MRVTYGTHADQWFDLWEGDPARPVAVLVHGGYWRDRFDASLMVPLDGHLSARGWTVANIEYRRSNPDGGSRWPAIGEDVLLALQHLVLKQAARGASREMILVGHSAGGHLALWAAEQPEIASHIAGVVALAPVTDLEATHRLGLGQGAVLELMPDGFSEQDLAAASPAEHPPRAPQLVVHGDDDDRVPYEQSVAYVDAARAAGVEATLLPIPGGDHFDVIEPAHAIWGSIDEWMLGRVSRVG